MSGTAQNPVVDRPTEDATGIGGPVRNIVST
jgi:hypothetical protein